MEMRFDAATDYARRMEGIHATEQLRRRVMTQAQQAAAQPQASAPRPRKRWRRVLGGALGVGIAAVLAAALVVPNIGLLGGVRLESPFAVQAYGSSDEVILPHAGAERRIIFDVEAETQRQVNADADRYANEGFYTGCVFGVQGEDIVRVQADISKGELYRMTSEEYTPRSNPELAQAVNGWKAGNVGSDGPLQRYDMVKHAVYYGSAEDANENEGRLRGDPDMQCDLRLYQRLGRTIDVSQADEPETALADYRFGLWTNIPFESVNPVEAMEARPEDEGAYEKALAYNLDAALDTLDGAVLTVTVTFADGTCATQEIALHAADMEAQAVPIAEGSGKAYELTPKVASDGVRASWEDVAGGDEYIRTLPDGRTVMHTLYGTVTAAYEGAFPRGEATHPGLERALTQPYVPEVAPYDPLGSIDPDDPDFNPSLLPKVAGWKVGDLGTTYRTSLKGIPADDAKVVVDAEGNESLEGFFYSEQGVSVTIDGVRRLDGLPEGVTLQDLGAWYDAGGRYDASLDHITEEGMGLTIAADGTLSPGFSYVAVDITVTNEEGRTGEAYLLSSDDAFARLTDLTDADGNSSYVPVQFFSDARFLWRSGHDGPAWDSHVLFQTLAPFERRSFTVLYVLSDKLLADDSLCLLYQGCQGDETQPTKGLVRVGSLM